MLQAQRVPNLDIQMGRNTSLPVVYLFVSSSFFISTYLLFVSNFIDGVIGVSGNVLSFSSILIQVKFPLKGEEQDISVLLQPFSTFLLQTQSHFALKMMG